MSLRHRMLSRPTFSDAELANIDDDEDADDCDEIGAAEAGDRRGVDASAVSTVSTVADRYGFLRVEHDAAVTEQSDVPLEVRRRRELKWVTMLRRWDHCMSANFAKVRRRCRKGIPSSVRARAWAHLCGGAYLLDKNVGVFDALAERPIEAAVHEQIVKDLHRQFPLHEMFACDDGPGQRELLRVLRAFVAYRPRDGYSQAQAPVASVLLMHMPAELAFWCLVSVCDKYLPGYYGPSMDAVVLDGQVLHRLLKKTAPHVHRHVVKHQLDAALYTVEWFMCVFCRTLPWASVLRVWDMFLCEGVKVLFAVALVLVRYTLGRSGVLRRCESLYDMVELLHSPPPEIMQEHVLVEQVQQLALDQKAVNDEYRRQISKQRRQLKRQHKQHAKLQRSQR